MNTFRLNLACKCRRSVCFITPNLTLIGKRGPVQEPPKIQNLPTSTSQWSVLWQSHVNGAAREAGAAAEIAASQKEAKYADIDSRFVLEPIAVKTLGVLISLARLLLSDLGRRITNISGQTRELSFLYQRVSVLVQRFNAILLHDCLPAADCADWAQYLLAFCMSNF